MTDPFDAGQDYDRLRAELQRLLAAPVKDMAAVARTLDALDAAHQRFKAEHGLVGNNPEE